MWIRFFWKNVEDSLEPYTLNNSTVVIDAQNYVYYVFNEMGLPYQFGCESDKYANKLREHLKQYQTANVNCLFVFKGGHENIDTELKIKEENRLYQIARRNFEVKQKVEPPLPPVLMKDIFREVLTEMGFKYIICQYESKLECVALAQEYKCPIISFDIEFCFYDTFYIPRITIEQNGSTLSCGKYHLERFLEKHRLSKNKLALFAVVNDRNIFEGENFNNFFKIIAHGKIINDLRLRNNVMLNWLSGTDEGDAHLMIKRFIENNDLDKFTKQIDKLKNMMELKVNLGIPSKYLMGHQDAQIIDNDKDWFEKGIASQHISFSYVNLVRSVTFIGSYSIEDTEADDALKLSLDIVNYAFNLLTNYENNGFMFYAMKSTDAEPICDKNLVPNPWDGENNVFSNGWGNIRSLGLFEHFIAHAMPEFNLDNINEVPENAQLLVLTLIYFCHKKSCDMKSEVTSVILSYVMLSIVPMNENELEKYLITKDDCRAAEYQLGEYFNITRVELDNIFDLTLLHPLVEFQHCLRHLNELNKLCGAPFEPTIYSTTYNATFVYKVLFDIKKEFNGNSWCFIQNKFGNAVSLLRFTKSVIDTVT